MESGESGTGATKTCPRCAEDVKAAALQCRFCGHQFEANALQDLHGSAADPSEPDAVAGDRTATPRDRGAVSEAAGANPRARAATWDSDLREARQRRQSGICEDCDRPTGNGRACQFCGQIIGANDGVRLAGIGQRLGAYLIDVIAIAVIVVVAMVMLRGALQSVFQCLDAGRAVCSNTSSNLAPLVVLVVGFVLLNLVLISGGQTLGKAIVGIRVGTYEGRRAGFNRTLLRDGIGKPLLTFFTAFIGTLWALWDKDRQALYDKVATTVVIDDRQRVPAVASSSRSTLIGAIVTLTAVAFIVALSSGARGAAPSTGGNASSGGSSSTLAPVVATPTPAPTHPYAVRLTAAQVVMPPSELQQASLVVEGDQAIGGSGWERDFTTAEFYHLQFLVYVWPDFSSGRADVARRACDYSFNSPPQPVATEVRADVIGDAAKACVYHWSTNVVDWYEYITATRNVTVIVAGEPRLTSGQAGAMNRMIQLARQQLAIIDRVAPP